MCGMYIINGVQWPEARSSEGNTSSNTQVSALIPRPAFHGMGRMCQRVLAYIKSCSRLITPQPNNYATTKLSRLLHKRTVIDTATSAYYALDIYKLSPVSMILKNVPINENSEYRWYAKTRIHRHTSSFLTSLFFITPHHFFRNYVVSKF